MTKDFVLPIMMFEGVGVFDGWRRAWPMVKAEGKRYAGFYGLKLVLRIAAGVLFTMVLFIFIFMMIIPVAIVIAIAVPGMKGGVHGAPLLIALLAVVILIGFAVLLLLVACFGTPIAVFFTSYTLQFFGSRYEPLRVILYPEPPLMPPPLVPVVPVTPLPPPVSA
jgi:hypothetical protein